MNIGWLFYEENVVIINFKFFKLVGIWMIIGNKFECIDGNIIELIILRIYVIFILFKNY